MHIFVRNVEKHVNIAGICALIAMKYVQIAYHFARAAMNAKIAGGISAQFVKNIALLAQTSARNAGLVNTV